MPSNKELRVWLLLGVVFLWAWLAWIIADQFLWPMGGTPEEVVRRLQRRTRLMRYFIGVFAGGVTIGMTRWVYWALCRALDTVKYEERAIQQMGAQALLDLCTSLEAKNDVHHGREV